MEHAHNLSAEKNSVPPLSGGFDAAGHFARLNGQRRDKIRRVRGKCKTDGDNGCLPFAKCFSRFLPARLKSQIETRTKNSHPGGG
jgi:hypothetical protein